MAKAVATCKCRTCGKEFTRMTYKTNRTEADSWEEWAAEHITECDECYHARIDAENKAEGDKAGQEAKEIGLPELTGSERQIAWAEQIRLSFIKNWDKEFSRLDAKKADIAREFYDWVIQQTKASFWIDRRYKAADPEAMMAFSKKAFLEDKAKKLEAEVEEKKEPEVLEPENKRSETVCKIKYTDEFVNVKSKYDPQIPVILKSEGYKWDPTGKIWTREMTYATGSSEDRAVEIANKLLLAGFPVNVPSEMIEKVVAGDYEPEHKRWISWSPDKKMLVVKGIDSKGLPGAKREYVPLESYDAIEEFAKLHDCRFSPGATEQIRAYKAKVLKVAPQAGATAEYDDTSDQLKKVLNSSRDVLDDLKED